MSKKSKELGRQLSSDVSISIEQNKEYGRYIACCSVGNDYYETDPYAKKQDAKDELLGFLETMKEKLSKAIIDLEDK